MQTVGGRTKEYSIVSSLFGVLTTKYYKFMLTHRDSRM